MKPSDVAVMLGLGRSTVTAWTSHEYKQYFSASAQGGQGRGRNFTDTDVRIMYALKVMKDDNTPPDSNHERLHRWQANDWNELPDMPDAPANFASVPMVPVAAAETALSTEKRSLMREIAMLQERVEQLLADRAVDRAEVTALLREIGDLRAGHEREIGDVRAELREAQTLLKLYEQGRLKPKE